MTAAAIPAESIDDRIARLKAELASLELQKLDDDMCEAAGAFLGVAQEAGDPSEIRAAIDFVRDAWKRFEAWRVAHRSEGIEVTAVRPTLALSPLDAPRPPAAVAGRRLAPGKLASREAIDAAVAASREQAETHRASVSLTRIDEAPGATARAATKCGSCGNTGHNARTCQKRASYAQIDDDPPRDDAAMADVIPASATIATPKDHAAIAARDRLVTEGLATAKRIAANHTRRNSARAGMADDIHSAALEGLVHAAGAYDPTFGIPFLAYAHRRITGAVLDFLRDQDHLSRDDRRKVKAGNVDLPPAPVSLEQEAEDFGDRIPDHAAADPSHVAEGSERIAAIEKASESLPERHREVLYLRYSRGMLLTQIGAHLGVTESRACQMLKEAHAQLRETLGVAAPFIDDVDDEEEAAPVAEAAPAPPVVTATSIDYVHPGRGWGPVGADGYAVHVLCNGTGQIRIKKLVRGCFPCSGTGRRACVKR